jgi:hypothetical protein
LVGGCDEEREVGPRGSAMSMVYVRGRTSDRTYHWCRNCPKYPKVYTHATHKRPLVMLCPDCEAREQEGSCREMSAR